ncbi:NUDIX hydrolase [Engelhardtia mirabilis]|uniref:GDP-mannose pyrophosphatase n=1 Tax=Engelhardtia mirabilis TaxID=2528011 RepID=A0A518BIX6_9BACT|nr:ADP-ribose pyrophosphatase [Planctomycetes bacterium Pla133]QDV01265.1 ADP-ribose pyrophosphatase [Planctomycetes bacterium Pla86]
MQTDPPDPIRGAEGADSLEREVLHRGRVFDLVRERIRLPSGLEQNLELVLHQGAVAVAPLTADGRLVCVRQYRHATGQELIEIPAGRVEAHEPRELAARRELEEETGLRCGSLELLTEFFPAPGFCSEYMSLYVARDLSPAGADRLSPDDDEELSTVTLGLEELIALPCRDAKTLVAAALLLRR